MILIELVLYALVAALGALGAHLGVAGTLAAAEARGTPGDAAIVLAAGRHATVLWLVAVGIVAGARAWSARRPGAHVPAPWVLPAALGACALGMTVQLGYGNPFRADWPGPPFVEGVLYGAIGVAVLLVVPLDLERLLARAHLAVGALVLALFGALLVFGDAPGASDQRINLGPVQPIEVVKVAAVAFLTDELARRAPKLRWQRGRIAALRFPRPRVLLPALATLLATLAGLFVVKDFGPTLILAGVFLGLFFVVTRSWGWVASALGTVAVMIAVFAWRPELVASSTVETRLHMWLDPWFNGIAHGDQLALARWALAAGGYFGVGLGAGHPGGIPAGHTDLVFAHLVEEAGYYGGLAWFVLMAAVVAGALWIGANNRTPERALLATGIGLLLAMQATVILGGTLGAIPLTGVVVPFLSFGKSSMVVFLAAVALVVRLAEDGRPRTDTEDLAELRAGIRGLGGLLVGVLVLFVGLTGWAAVLRRDTTTLQVAVTTLGDGTPALLADPRLDSLAARIRRGSVLDRNAQPLAVSPGPGTRIHPLGDALGTVLGPAEGDLLRPRWSVERQHDEQLRGYPTLEDGPAIWLGRVGGRDRLLLAVPSTNVPGLGEEAEARRRLERRGGEGDPRRLPLLAPDYRPLLPVARLPVAEREAEITRISEDVAARSVTLSLDAVLQVEASQAARAAAKLSKVGAAAVVVLDADSGQILARAQWPDYDPGRGDWRAPRIAGDPRFMGIYGAWADKTGAQGVYQAGSVFKVLTSLVATRVGLVSPQGEGEGCPTGASPRFACNEVSDGKTAFSLPGWKKPIHDFGDGGARGEVDLVAGLTRSSNVYFGQLALRLGPEPFRQLREAGVEFGNPGLLEERETDFTGIGTAGSRRLALTGFGQGAGSWNVAQAARLVAAVANGGTYVRCPADMLLSAACTQTPLLAPGTSVEPILAGMRGVMERGTGARLPRVPGVRVYGKTGTADAPGTRDEAPWGIRPGQVTAPHSWFVAIAESEAAPACALGTPGRFVVAAVVPHGGFGASAAGPLAMKLVGALQRHGYLPGALDPGEAAPGASAGRGTAGGAARTP